MLTEKTFPTADRERHYDLVADLELLHFRTGLNDFAHKFMSYDVSLLHRRNESVIEVKVRSADRRPRYPHDRIMRIQYLRVGHLFHPHISWSKPTNSLHRIVLWK